MIVVKYISEAWALRKADANLLDVFQKNCLRIVLGTRLTCRILNSRFYEKYGSIPLSRAIMKERLKWLGHVLRMKDDRLPDQEMRTSWEGVKSEALDRLDWRRSVRSCVGLRRLGAAVSYY